MDCLGGGIGVIEVLMFSWDLFLYCCELNIWYVGVFKCGNFDLGIIRFFDDRYNYVELIWNLNNFKFWFVDDLIIVCWCVFCLLDSECFFGLICNWWVWYVWFGYLCL